MVMLDGSGEIARDALSEVVAAFLPTEVYIDGKKVALASQDEDGLRIVTGSWTGGSVKLRARSFANPQPRRAQPADNGPNQVFEIQVEGQQTIWIAFEWQIRDAIRANDEQALLLVSNLFQKDISAYGVLAREIARRSDLDNSSWATVGAYRLDTLKWDPDPAKVLTALVKMAIIKAHVFDRAKGTLVKGTPLFALAPGSTSAPMFQPGARVSAPKAATFDSLMARFAENSSAGSVRRRRSRTSRRQQRCKGVVGEPVRQWKSSNISRRRHGAFRRDRGAS